MKYVDKVMLKAPYPVLYDQNDLQLYTQIGTAFVEDEEKGDFAGLVKCPITTPFCSIPFDCQSYVNINDPQSLDYLCMEGETVGLFNLYVVMMNASRGSLAKDCDFSWIRGQLKDERVAFKSPDQRQQNVVLTYGRPLPSFRKDFWYFDGMKPFFEKELLNGGVFSSLFMWSYSSDMEQMVIDFVRQARAYDYLYKEKDFYPSYEINLAEGAPDFDIERFTRLFNMVLIYKRSDDYVNYTKGNFWAAVIGISNWNDQIGNGKIFTCKEIEDETLPYREIYRGDSLKTILDVVCSYRIGFTSRERNFYIERCENPETFRVVDIDGVAAFKEENKTCPGLRLRQYLVGEIDH